MTVRHWDSAIRPTMYPIDGFVSGNGRNHHREFVDGCGQNQSTGRIHGFQRAIFRNCVRFSATGRSVTSAWTGASARESLDAADGVYDQLKQLVVCKNTNAGAWGPFTAASTNWSSCSSRAARSTSIISARRGRRATAPTSLVRWRQHLPKGRAGISLRTVDRKAHAHSWPTSSSIAPTAAISIATLLSARAPPAWRRT